MLILTRRIGERIMIGNDINVTILGVNGLQVRVGVNAPKEVEVHRQEIYERIRHEQCDSPDKHGPKCKCKAIIRDREAVAG